VVQVMAAAQRWAQAATREALAQGLIAEPQDGLFLELEELKQVATGEWHGGRTDAIRDAVAARRAQYALAATQLTPAAAPPRQVSPGRGAGPAYRGAPATEPPPAGALWLREAADAGCAAFWLCAEGLAVAGADPWAPGVMVARALGLPVLIGAAAWLAQTPAGGPIAIGPDAAER
jgi:hypothetical protein